MTKAVFLDRDGVINREPKEGEYITSWDDFRILPGVADGIALLNRAEYMVFVVTNQRCVAKGLLSVADLEKIHEQMSQALSRAGAKLDGIYYCPHDYEPSCDCRKPAPGMLLGAAQVHGIDLRSSWMVGDSETDIQAGKSAGCKTARVSTEPEEHDTGGDAFDILGRVEIRASSLLDSVRQILEWDARPRIDVEKRNVIA
jgi:D-glycero-D-manno-heptose 1,7-bisphosphate phosphatase